MDPKEFLYIYANDQILKDANKHFEELNSQLAESRNDEETRVDEIEKETGDAIPHLTKQDDEIKLLDKMHKKQSNIRAGFSRKRHNMFVETCLAPRGYKKDSGEVYAIVNEIEDIGDESCVTISLLTPLMAYTDSMYFDQEYIRAQYLWRSEYRPYYFEFTAIVNKDKLKTLKQRVGKWFLAKLQISVNKAKEQKNKNLVTDNDMNLINGIVTFGGSKAFMDKVTLIITSNNIKGEVLAELQNLYSVKLNNKKSLDEYLNNTFSDEKANYEVEIVNVGQANCIRLKNQKTRATLFFDFGQPLYGMYDRKNEKWIKNPDMKTNSAVKSNLGKLFPYIPDCILISHWHSDHFEAFRCANKNALTKTWVVPSVSSDKTLTSAKRLIKYIVANQTNNEVFFLDGKEPVYDNNNGLQIWKGTSKSQTDFNAGSYILKINKTIFAGDCLYEYWPDKLQKQLNDVTCLIVPHHGSALDKKGYNASNNIAVIKKFNTKKKEAYVSVGWNMYSHPDDYHLNELKKQGFNVFKTNDNSTIGGYKIIV